MLWKLVLLKINQEKIINDKALTGKSYTEAVGSLLYLSKITRPDISLPVNYLSCQVNQPKITHWKMIEHIFQYLHRTDNFEIFCKGNTVLKAYSDNAEIMLIWIRQVEF